MVAEDDGRYFGLLSRETLTGSLATLTIRGEGRAARDARLDRDHQRSPGSLAVRLVDRLRREGRLVAPSEVPIGAYDAGTAAIGSGPAAIARALAQAPGVASSTADPFTITRILRELRAAD